MRFETVIAGALVASLGVIADTRGAGPRFYPDDPIAVDHDRLIVGDQGAQGRSRRLLRLSQEHLCGPGRSPEGPRRQREHAGRGAGLQLVHEPDRRPRDVAARTGARAQSRRPLRHRMDDRPRQESRLFIPAFRAIDRSDRTKTVYQLEVDPPAYPEMPTGAEVIGTAFYHAFGYNTVEMYLAEVDPAALEIAPKAWIKDANGRRPFVRHDLDLILKNAARMPNGHIRVSREAVGQRRRHGAVRVPRHARRRPQRHLSARAPARAAWQPGVCRLAQSRRFARAQYDGDASQRDGHAYLQYHIVDFGSTLGSATRFPNEVQEGHEYTLAKRPSL